MHYPILKGIENHVSCFCPLADHFKAKNRKGDINMKKILSAAFLLAGMLLASTGSVYAEENNLPYVNGLGYEENVVEELFEIKPLGYDSGWKNFLGGRWRHGVGKTKVWSNYDHKSKPHKTTVRGAGGKYSSSGWIKAGTRASASWEKARVGNKAWVDVK